MDEKRLAQRLEFDKFPLNYCCFGCIFVVIVVLCNCNWSNYLL